MDVSNGFIYLDHMTDAIIEAYGSNLDEAFENSARGLVNTMFDLSQVSPSQEIKIEAKGYDLEGLLYDWLEKVMLVLLTENVVLSDFKVKISENEDSGDYRYLLSCPAKGESLDVKKHRYKVEIKAVTYHQMEIKQEQQEAEGKNKVTTRFLLDL